MRRLLNSYGARVTAFLLCCVFALATIVCGAGFAYTHFEPGMGADDERDFFNSELAYDYAQSQVWNALERAYQSEHGGTENGYLPREPEECFSYVICRPNATVVDTRQYNSRRICPNNVFDWPGDYTAECYVNLPAARGTMLYGYITLYDFLYNARSIFLPVALGGLLLTLLLFVFLMAAAGRTEEGVKLGGFHRWPLELYLLLLGGAAALSGAAMVNLSYGDVMRHLDFFIAVFGLLTLAAGSMALLACMTLSARFRAGKWWRNTLTFLCIHWGWIVVKWCWKLFVRLCRWCWKLLRGVCRGCAALLRALPLGWKGALVYGVFVLINFLFVSFGIWEDGVWFLFLVLFDLAGLFVVLWVMLQLNRLQTAGRALAAGDLNIAVDTRHMLPVLKEHADNLGAVSLGMTRAVNERMKSERFKTELITNVSHDLKTPLTSIVSYVELLKSEPIESEKAREYIEVLDRQSQRLKKLTTDLVDASKASSGVLNVSPEPVDLAELVRQSAGEYAERFALAELKPVLSLPESAIVTADGRLLWRVLDNLLTNVVKYALPGTRVYLDVEQREHETAISVKNISREALNIPAEELMERFVRGDESRHTEGSGLGLSIARSLMELMGGELRLTLDGDLFKAEILFRK